MPPVWWLHCAAMQSRKLVPIPVVLLPNAVNCATQFAKTSGRLAAKAQVTDAILDKCKPIAGTPEDCIAAIKEYQDAGCTHVMLELWGEDRHEQIRLFGEQVLPHVRN